MEKDQKSKEARNLIQKRILIVKDYAIIQWDDLIWWSFISSTLQIELLKHFDE